MFSHSSHVMTLANSIIGVGILAMPFCFQKCGIILSILLLILSNWITRICCHFLIKISLLTRRKSFEFLGFHAFGSSGKLLVELCIIGYLIGTCITYFVVIGDLGPQIVTKMFNLNGEHPHLRTFIMGVVTLVCILPLGMLKNVDSLSTICTASIGFYVCLVVKIILESGAHIQNGDWTDKVVYWEPAGVLQCLPIISMALSCQMQIFEVFSTINNQSAEKLNGIVKNATWICTCVYVAVGFFGYVAFCTQPFSGNILVNLAPSFSSDVIKIGFVLSVAFSFPLVIFPCRASIYSLLYRKSQMDTSAYIPESRFKAITSFIVGFALCVALMIPSVELIIGLVGSTIGVAICIMFPASSFRKIILKNTTERHLAQIVLVGGFCLMILGTYANLNAIDEKQSGVHLDHPLDIKLELESHEKLFDKKILQFENDVEKELQGFQKKPDVEIKIKTLEEQNLALHKEEEAKGKSPIPPKNEEPLAQKPSEEAKDLPPILPEPNKDPPSESALSNKDPPNPAKEEIKMPNKIVIAKAATAQSIDSEALKNNEIVAAEEQNLKILEAEKSTKEQLKETQKELKETKDLIVKTVDELKEELKKQTKETNTLVEEKINQMVEKVEEIGRNIQEKQDKIAESEIAKAHPDLKPQTINEKLDEVKENTEPKTQKENLKETLINKDKNNEATRPGQSLPNEKNPQVIVNKLDLEAPDDTKTLPDTNQKQEKLKENVSLLSKLIETPINLRSEEKEAHAGVYEPMSYKAGELIENEKLISQQQQRLPPHLALLFNSTANRLNASLPAQANDKPESQKVAYEKPHPPDSLSDSKPKEFEAKENSIKQEIAELKEKKLQKEEVKDNDNVEAIRRDLLQVNLKKLDNADTTLSANAGNDSLRSKRDLLHKIEEVPVVRKPEEGGKESCLSEPKIDELMAGSSAGSSLAFDLQKQTLGRQLKSVDDNEK